MSNKLEYNHGANTMEEALGLSTKDLIKSMASIQKIVFGKDQFISESTEKLEKLIEEDPIVRRSLLVHFISALTLPIDSALASLEEENNEES